MSRLSKIHNWLKVEETEEMKESKGHLWTNADLAPNPPETRKWDSWSFFLFQVHYHNSSSSRRVRFQGDSAEMTVFHFVLAYNI